MRVFYVRKEWSASDIDYVIVFAQSKSEVEAYYKAIGDRGPRYVSVHEAEGGCFELKAGKMKPIER
jgi:hypothetical protein